jgi:hypothetical protein
MRKTKMKNAGKMFLRFGLLSTMNNFRIRFYWTVFHWFWKRSDIREAEVTSPGNQYFLKDLPAVMLPDIVVKFAERAAGTVLKLDYYFHMRD